MSGDDHCGTRVPCCMGSAASNGCTCKPGPLVSSRQRDAAELAMYRREFPVLAERHRNALAELDRYRAGRVP